MAKGKQRQALAASAMLSSPRAEFPGRAIMALEEEAARVMADYADKRLKGGAGGHIVLTAGGVLSGFFRDGRTTVQFEGGAVAVTTHD
jgi:hypothetical protein